jgi:hypothetical protein
VVLSIEERVFLLNTSFEKAIDTAIWCTRLLSVGSSKIAVYCDRAHMRNELKTAITVCIRNNSQADLQKWFMSKIKRVRTSIDARGHHFQ